MGNNAFEITLHRDLLKQRPAAVGVRLQPERTAQNTSVPTQAIGSDHLQRPIQSAAPAEALQHRLHPINEAFLHIAQVHAGKIWSIGWNPHFPFVGMSHPSLHPLIPPAGCHTVRRLKTGVRTGNPPRNL